MPRPDYTWNDKRQCWEKNVRKADGKYTKLRSYGRGSLSELRKMVRDFEIEQERIIPHKDGKSFADVAEEWFAFTSVGKRYNTIAKNRYHLDKKILPIIGDIEIEKLKLADIDRLIVSMSDKKESSNRITLSVVKSVLAYAQEQGINVMSIPRSRKALGEKSLDKEALTREQQEKLLDAVKGRKCELFVKLCLFAGLRESEACGLLWEDVHLEGDYPYIRVCHTLDKDRNISSVTKTKSAIRSIPIPEILASALREAPHDVDTVLSTTSGKPQSQKNIQKIFLDLDAVRNLGFRVYPHLLRHTYISELCAASAETGLDIKTIQSLAGHSNPQITMQIYAHVMKDRQEDTAKKIQNVFSGR